MRILHLISSAGFYGAEAMLINLMRAQRRAGIDARLLAFDNQRGVAVDIAVRAKECGVPVALVPCHGRFDRLTIEKIVQILKTWQISIIHSHGYKSNFYALLAARRATIPFLATCHLWTGSTLSVRLYEWIDAYVLGRASRVVAVSDQIAADLVMSGLRTERVSVIYNGIDVNSSRAGEGSLRSELGLSSGALVGAVARLEEQKGLRYLIEAARSVLDQGQEVHFAVVGDGPLRSALQKMINELGLDRHISLLGRRDDMSNIYASLDLLVMPSLDEGLPMVLLEAMSAGVPVIATPVGAVPRLLHDGETGLLVEPRDVGGLRGCILNMLRKPDLAMTMGMAGRTLVRNHFSADAMAGQYEHLYSSLLRSAQTETITA